MSNLDCKNIFLGQICAIQAVRFVVMFFFCCHSKTNKGGKFQPISSNTVNGLTLLFLHTLSRTSTLTCPFATAVYRATEMLGSWTGHKLDFPLEDTYVECITYIA